MNEQNEKQAIEKMANILEQAKIDARATIGSMNYGFGMWYAKACYNAGYRKQSEGEWVKTGDGITERVICSNCKSEKGSFMRPPFCNQCGAKMK